MTDSMPCPAPWLPISTVSGHNEGWIKPEAVFSVEPGSGQRIVHWRDGQGRARLSQRQYGFSDEIFMDRLGLALPPLESEG